MTKVKMTIHRGLSELKLIDAKIAKQINEIQPVGIHQKDKLVYNYLKKEDFESQAKSKYDSVIDLIERKSAIKSAIVCANAVTKVKINEKEMTIADAINFKAAIKFKKSLVEVLKSKKQKAVADLYVNNKVVNDNCQKLLEFTFGKESTKVDAKDLDAVRKPYMDSNEFHLFDPLDTTQKIDDMEKEISQFEAEVDAVLSEINAVTFIEI